MAGAGSWVATLRIRLLFLCGSTRVSGPWPAESSTRCACVMMAALGPGDATATVSVRSLLEMMT